MPDPLTRYVAAVRTFSTDVRKYLITSALFGFSYFGLVGVLLNLYLLRLGYGTEFIGLVNGATALAFAISSLPSGAIGSRFGSRRTVVAGVACVALGMILMPIAAQLPAALRDGAILITRLLSGLGFSLYLVNAYPYLVATTTPRERTYVFSMQTALLPIMGFAGSLFAGVLPLLLVPLLGATLQDPAPFAVALIAAGVLLVPAVLVLLSTTERATEASTRVAAPRKAATMGKAAAGTPAAASRVAAAAPVALILFLALTGMLRMTGEAVGRSFFNVYLEVGLGESTARIGLLLAVGQLIAGPAALAAPWLAERLGKVTAIVVSVASTAVSLVVMGVFPHWLLAGLGFAGVLGMRAVTQSVAGVLQMEIVPVRWRAITSGAVSMAMGTGFTSMALGGGYLIPVIGFRGLYFLAAGLVALGALVFWLYFRVPQGEYRQPPADGAPPVVRIP